MKRILSILALCVMVAGYAWAQQPTFHTFSFEDQSIIQGMSDNGKWAVASGGEASEARLINLDTYEAISISTTEKAEKANDVSNDGTIVVGSQNAVPVYYSTMNKTWQTLETKSPYVYGTVKSVTTDGKFGVGTLYYNDGYYSIPALWNLKTGKLVSVTGLPTKDMSHQNQGQMDFRKISGDGRYILGCMSYSYLPTALDLGGCFFFVYDREKEVSQTVGFLPSDVSRWAPKCPDMQVIMEAYMSNNGRYVTGSAHITKEIEGEVYADEYKIPFLYDVANDKFTGYDESSITDSYGSAVTNDGVVIDVTPEGNPVREWSIRSGQYWFSFNEILQQKYSTTIKDATTSDNSGTVNCISDDGRRLTSFPDPYSSYFAELPEALSSMGQGIKLLGSYRVSPVEGSEVSHLKTVSLTFDRTIAAVGGSDSAKLLDEKGNVVSSSSSFQAEGKVLTIRFSNGALQEGQKHTLYIPQGSVSLDNDAAQTNNDIHIIYYGRASEAVKVQSIYPEQGTAFSFIDYSTSPVLVTFNTNIILSDDAKAQLYRNDEMEPFCDLTMAYSGRQIALYPSTLQYLYDGSTYRIEVSAGAVTDVAGNDPSEAFTIDYKGNYVREVSADDIILFSDNFDNGLGQFMQWCGDQNTPTDEMVNWDFEKGMAWGLVRDDEASDDRMATSHSMYATAGQSDDWLVTPQLYIPDMLCSVKFLSQSYLQSKNDVLKVIVWESNNVYNTIDASIVDKMKAEGVVVLEERQSPGKTEGVLGGEWTSNDISLAQFAGKNVYIAFVNQNKDQSAIFLDSLEVRHDMNYLVSLEYEESVINRQSIDIRGSLTNNSKEKTYQKAILSLKDEDGKVVALTTLKNMNLQYGDRKTFTFSESLPLTVGRENKFTLFVSVDGEQNELHGAIKDLAFQPQKRVVLEEYTGRSCGNCPLGILAFEKLQKRYGSQFIPISIHTYNNDPLSRGLSNYTSLLGIDQMGAPSGIVNRANSCYPATSAEVDGVARYFFQKNDTPNPEGNEKLWADYVADEMAVPAESDINITGLTYDAASSTFKAQCEIRYALNADNQTVNLFTVLLEDNLSMAQQNYMSSVSSPDLGEWGLGGLYGQSVVSGYIHQDVARNINGVTINGTGGYLPSSVEAGKTYTAEVQIEVPSHVQSLEQCKIVVMMIDANTGRVINAALCKNNSSSLIDELCDINLGELQLDKEYALTTFKSHIGTFTAPRSGVLSCSATTNDVLYPYKRVQEDMFAEGNAYDVTMNSLYGGRSYDFSVEQGKTYYFYTDFVMDDNTVFTMTMADEASIKLTSTSPSEGGVFHVSNGGQVVFDFDKAVTFTRATLLLGGEQRTLRGSVSTNSIYFDVKADVWDLLSSGKAKEGDTMTITIEGVAQAANSNVLCNGDGRVVLHLTLGAMPIQLVSTEHTEGNLLSYYAEGDDEGLVQLHFSGRVQPDQLSAQLKFGNIDKDGEGEYYVEYLEPTVSADGTTVIVNLQGKRRKAIDMVSSGTNYGTIVLGITGVKDTAGNYAFAEGQGSLGSYWFAYTLKEVDGGASAIEGIRATTQQPIYNLNGQRVGKGYRGIVVKGGKLKLGN